MKKDIDEEFARMRSQRDEAVSLLREMCGYLEGLGSRPYPIDEDEVQGLFVDKANYLRRSLERIGDRPISDMKEDVELAERTAEIAQRRHKVASRRANNLEQWRNIVCAEHPELWEFRQDLTTPTPEVQ